MATSELNYTTVATAIGEVCIWWSGIEALAHGVALRLAILNEPNLYRPNARTQLNLTLSNMDQRELFATAKALAFHGSSDDVFPQLEPILNRIDNVLRIERNRFVHDSWFASGAAAQRTQRGTRVVNIQAREKALSLNPTTQYSSFAEIDALAGKLKAAYSDLEKLDKEIIRRLDERAQQPGWLEQYQ